MEEKVIEKKAIPKNIATIKKVSKNVTNTLLFIYILPQMINN